jgi:hypothetical protein
LPQWFNVKASLFGDEIKNKHVGHAGAKRSAKGLVGGMDQVSIAIRGILEGEFPAMGETFIQLLGTHVCARLERLDLMDFGLQGAEIGVHLLDLLGCGGIGKLEADDMVDFAFDGGVRGQTGAQKTRKKDQTTAKKQRLHKSFQKILG